MPHNCARNNGRRAPDRSPNLDIKLGMKKSDEDWEIIKKAQTMLKSGIILSIFKII
jgi:hypothetical protein